MFLKDTSSANSSYYKQKVWASMQRHVGPFDREEEFLKWLDKNEGTIQFDPETKVFKEWIKINRANLRFNAEAKMFAAE